MSKVVVENLRSAIYASYEELSAQVQADSALDTKLLGLLGFLAAAGSLLLTVAQLPHGRTLLLVGVGFGAVRTRINHQGLELRRRALAVAIGAPVAVALVYSLERVL
jgi:hypothetical protein